ncbi:hypothetical protein [Arcticibacter tournemirensis]
MNHLHSVPKTHAFAMPRHLRYVFLIDSGEPSTLIMKLIMDNYKLWGGRFNPFVPVYANQIPEAYLPIIRHSDPDFIYHSPRVNINLVRQQITFSHPKAYLPLREDGRNNFPGVIAAYMLAEVNHSIYTFSRNRSFMHTSHQIDALVPDFYKLSFGFQPRYIEQDVAFNGYKSFEINNDTLQNINRAMCEELPSLTSMLSELKSDPRIFSASNDWDANKFELIIYNPEDAFEDLLYFWNRRLFQYKDQIRLKQIIATAEEIRALILDENFEVSLHSMVMEKVFVTSRICQMEELETLVREIRRHFTRISIAACEKSEFPYPVLRTEKNDYHAKYTVKQVLNDVKDYLHFPSPFSTNYLPGNSSYMVDVSLILQKDDIENELKPPFGTSTHIFAPIAGRIDGNNRITFNIQQHEPGTDFYIPTSAELIQIRLSQIEHEEKYEGTRIGEPRPSAAGLKLSSFINLFKENWHEIDYYLSDPFWINLIKRTTLFGKEKSISLLPILRKVSTEHSASTTELERKSVKAKKDSNNYIKLQKSNIADLKGFFCNKDLVNELTRYYFDHLDLLREKLHAHKIDTTNTEALCALIQNSVKEDMLGSINTTLQYFVSAGILFLGMRIKCEHCGTHAWYPLKTIDNRMPCEGCLNEISPSVTSELYYRFNDIVVNNVKSFSKPNGDEFDGNYIVLRTLAHLYEKNGGRIKSFMYGTCLDINMQDETEPIKTDIDLVFIEDGKLIIGEAKADSKEFKKKEIDNIIKVANRVKADGILLAYEKGRDIAAKIEMMRAGLDDPNCTVSYIKVPEPFHKTGKIFGMSHAGLKDPA